MDFFFAGIDFAPKLINFIDVRSNAYSLGRRISQNTEIMAPIGRIYTLATRLRLLRALGL